MPTVLSSKQGGSGGGGGGPPTGSAGGVLSGTYPNPGFAVDMATQAELDAAIAGVTAGTLTDDYAIVVVGSTISAYDKNGAVAFSGTDLGAILTSCMNALASSAGNPVGSISLGPGDFSYTTRALIPRVAASAGVAQLLDPGWLRIHGAGGATRIINNVSSGNESFLWFNRSADYDTFGHIQVEDLLWDANDNVGHYAFIGAYDNTSTSRQRINIRGIHGYRLQMINAPTAQTSVSHVGLAWLDCAHVSSAEATANHIDDIVFEDCNGIDNGNWFIVTTGGAGTGTDANVLINNVYITRCKHTIFHALIDGDQAANSATITVESDPTMADYGLFDATERFPASGKVVMQEGSSTAASALVIITYTGKTATTLTGCSGGTAGKTLYNGSCVGLPVSDNFIFGNEGHIGVLRVTDCEGGYSGDNSMEIDNASDVVVRGYTAENCANNAIYYQNYATPRINYDQQRIVFESCFMRATLNNLDMRMFGIGSAGSDRHIKEIVIDKPDFTRSGSRLFNTLGTCLYTQGSGTPSFIEKLTIIEPKAYWTTSGVGSLLADSAPIMFWFRSSVAGAQFTMRGGNLFFDGAAPTLNAHSYVPGGVVVDGTDVTVDLDFNFRNDAGSTAASNSKGAVVLGEFVATSPRGRIRVVCDSYTNDTAAHLVSLTSNVTLDADHRIDIEADAGGLPAGGLLYWSATAANDAYVRINNSTWPDGGLVPPSPTLLSGLTTDVGKQMGRPVPSNAVFKAGTGDGISIVEYSTDAGTTYTPLFSNYPPILTPVERGTSSGTSTNTTAFSPATTLAAGTVGLIAAFSASNKSVASVADSVGGNTWNVEVADGDGTRMFTYVSCQVVNPITSGDTITITWSAATNAARDVWLFECDGLATSSLLDKNAKASGTSTTAVSIGPTAALAQKNELCFAIIRSQAASPTFAHGATWNDPATPSLDSRTVLEWKIVNGTTAVTADGTWSSTVSGWNGLLATFKGVAATPSVMPSGIDLVVGPLSGDALIRSEFSTTQPTITLVPV